MPAFSHARPVVLGSGGPRHSPPPNAFYDASRAVLSLRFDDSDPAASAVVLPELVSRGLTAGFALVSGGSLGLDAPGRLTTASARAIQAAGNEIMCHSKTHGSDPADTSAFYVETVGAAQSLRARGLAIYNFVQPGSWIGAANHYNLTTTAFWGTPEDQMLRRAFCAYDAYMGANISSVSGRALPNTGVDRWGANHIVADTWTLQQIKSAIDWIVELQLGQEVLIHPALIGGAGLSLATFQAVLDYAAAWKATGLLDVVNPSVQAVGSAVQGAWSRYSMVPTVNIDTRLDQGNPTTPLGSDTAALYFSLWSAGRIFRSLETFDLTTLAGKTVQNPYLFLHLDNAATPAAFNVNRILAGNSWTKAGACWNARLAGTAWLGTNGCSTSGTDYSATPLAAYAGGVAVPSMNAVPLALDAAEFAAMIAANEGMRLAANDEGTISAVQWAGGSKDAQAPRIPRLIAQYHA